jgi:hypothetical protein
VEVVANHTHTLGSLKIHFELAVERRKEKETIVLTSLSAVELK